MLSLVTFDVQGAYNGVHKHTLAVRLWERGIPTTLIKWINSFCSNRKACITFDRFCSDTMDIAQAGLPQGSPLSPILYIFYNVNLVQAPINFKRGAIAFVDDYSAWVTGPNASANTAKLQQTFIPRAMNWARESEATFEVDKTELIHFTRVKRKDERPHLPIIVNGKTILLSEQVKLLGVVLDL